MKYYQKLSLLLALMWGFIGVQRLVIAIIMPAIQADMKFTYTQVGLVLSVTAFVWAFGTVLWAAVGDHFGRRPVIVACAVLASVFSWMTGLVHSLGQMLAVRGILGLFEGGPVGPAVATLSEEVPEKRRAMVAGIFLGGFLLIGVCFAPPIAVRLLESFGGWRPVFYVISIPGLITAGILAFVMREPPSIAERLRLRKAGKKLRAANAPNARLVDVVKYKNVVLSTVNSVPVMAWLWIYTGFSALFLTQIHHFSMESVGLIMSASGIGAFLGELTFGALSDRIGRKKTLIVSAFLCATFGISVALLPLGTSVPVFCVFFFFWAGFGGGMYPMYLGTLPAEAVPPEIAGTATALPTAAGETLGAALMPTIAGMLADKFSLFAPMWMAGVAGIFICVISLFYVETAPRCVARMKYKPAQEDHLLPWFRPVKEMAASTED